MKIHVLRVLLALSPVIAFSAISEENDTLIISATRSHTALENTPKSISILTAEDIENRPGLNGIQGLLAELPGIDYAQSGGLGGQLVMRGFNTNEERGVMAIDGDRYLGRNTLQFNMIDPASIERIEVIRGPVSSLYGSDAMTGVINIITRRSSADPFAPFQIMPKLRSLTYSSSNNLTQGRVELDGGGNGFDILIGAHYSHADDFHTAKGKAINSAFHYKGTDFNIGYSPQEQQRWELSGRYQYVATGRAGGLGGAPGYPVHKVNENPIIEKYLRLSFKNTAHSLLSDNFDAALYVRDLKTDIYQTKYTNQVISEISKTMVYSPVVYGGHLTVIKDFNSNSLSYGGDFYYEDFKSRQKTVAKYDTSGELLTRTANKKLERDSKSFDIGLFINDNWRITDKWTVDTTVRGDYSSVHIAGPTAGESETVTGTFMNNTRHNNTEMTGAIGTIYKVTPEIQLMTNLSRGFRAPTGYTIVGTSIAGVVTTLPAPDLQPESNISGELGIRYSGKRHKTTLTWYRSNYTDLISRMQLDSKSGGTVFQPRNIGKAVITGVELEGQQYWTDSLSSGYSFAWTQGTDKSNNVPIPNIAPFKGVFSVKYDSGKWYAEGVMTGYGKKTRINPKQERNTASYALFDLYAGMPLSTVFGTSFDEWKLTAGLENIFNRAARNPVIFENVNQSRDYLGNPLYSQGRSFVLKISGTY